jgi:hypothetical protein
VHGRLLEAMAVMVVTLPVNGRHFGRESLLEKKKKKSQEMLEFYFFY